MSRRPVNDDVVAGYRVKAGSLVLISPYVTHRDPEIWDDLKTFRPERFEPESAAARPEFSYLPFGGGPRRCIGNRLAMMEMQLVVATVAQRFVLGTAAGGRVEPEPVVTLRPRRGLPASVRAR